MPVLNPRRRAILFSTLVLACLVGAVFWPILGFEFVDYDVEAQVIDNPHIRGLTGENLEHILTSPCLTSYYPVRTLTFAVDYQLWGLNPAGYKLTGGLIHLANVLLIFWLVLRLFGRWAEVHGPPDAAWDVPAAAFSAAVFAIHPAVVEPVTWVAGREELLVALGALGCLHFHLSARRLEQEKRTGRALVCYGAAACSCAAACLSNAVGAVVPLLITAWDALTLTSPRWWKLFRGTIVLWLIGAATIWIKLLCSEDFRFVQEVEAAGAFSPDRLVLALMVYWLHLKAVVWPVGLTPWYDWLHPQGPFEPAVILGGIAVALTGGLLWLLRRRKLALFGVLWFLVALAPTLHLIPHHIFRADRYLYLPLAGLVLAVALGLRPLAKTLPGRRARLRVAAVGLLLLLVLVLRTAAQVQTWHSSLSVWSHCLSLQPNCAKAHDAFADNLVKGGRPDQAVEHYRRALEQDPMREDTVVNLVLQLTAGPPELRDFNSAIPMIEEYCAQTGWEDPELLRTLGVAYTNFAAALENSGHFELAIDYYSKALAVYPDYEICLFNLALLRSTCPKVELRRPEEAVRLAERACQLVGEPTPNDLRILAAAYAEAGQTDRATAAIERAMAQSRAAGDANLTNQLQADLDRYRGPRPAAGTP